MNSVRQYHFQDLRLAAFALTMSVVRFGGDFIRDRLGAVRTLQICTVLAMIGMLVAGVAPNAIVAMIGFGICGLGISNMVPIAFSAAGNLPGYARGVALSVVTFLGYSGALFAPSIIGFIAEHTGFKSIFLGCRSCFLSCLPCHRLPNTLTALRLQTEINLR